MWLATWSVNDGEAGATSQPLADFPGNVKSVRLLVVTDAAKSKYQDGKRCSKYLKKLLSACLGSLPRRKLPKVDLPTPVLKWCSRECEQDYLALFWYFESYSKKRAILNFHLTWWGNGTSEEICKFLMSSHITCWSKQENARAWQVISRALWRFDMKCLTKLKSNSLELQSTSRHSCLILHSRV